MGQGCPGDLEEDGLGCSVSLWSRKPWLGAAFVADKPSDLGEPV